MATNVYTASYQLDSLKRRGLVPSNARLTDADLIEFFNDAQVEHVVPLLLSVRENYYEATEDTPLVQGQTLYALPSRATAETISQVLLLDSSGCESPLNRVERIREQDWYSDGWTFQDNKIRLIREPVGFETLRVVYFREPSRLVPLADCATVLGIIGSGVEVDVLPEDFAIGETVDFVAADAGFRGTAFDCVITNIETVAENGIELPNGGTALVTLSAPPTGAVAGNYVALAGQTPIPQVPKSMHKLLAQSALCMVLEALKDQRLKAARERLDEIEKRVLSMIAPRAKNAPRVVSNRYGPGYRWGTPAFLRRW